MTARRVVDLIPGDEVTIFGGSSAVFVARTDHPIWPNLQLVVWRLPKGHPIGEWSHDALSPVQEVGDVTRSTPDERQARLRAALLGGRS